MGQYKKKYLKYKMKYLTLKSNLEFAVKNSKNFNNGKKKYLELKKQKGGLKKPFNMKCLQTCKIPEYEHHKGDCLLQCFKSTLKHGFQVYDEIMTSKKSIEQILIDRGEKPQLLNPWKVSDYKNDILIDDKTKLTNRLIDIYSRIEPNYCMILIINKYNKTDLPDKKLNGSRLISRSGIKLSWHAVIVGRTEHALILYDPKWHSLAINNDIINQPYDPNSKNKLEYQYKLDIMEWNDPSFFNENKLALFVIQDRDGMDVSQIYDKPQVEQLLRNKTYIRGLPDKPTISRQPTHIADPDYLPRDIKKKCADYNTFRNISKYKDTLCVKNGCFYDRKTGDCKSKCSSLHTTPRQEPYETKCYKNGCWYNKRTGKCYRYRNK